jgi:transcriptional regulator with XRE-family HTH domain
MTIGERIFKILKEKNIKQKDFSLRTGISESTVSDWKRKQTNPASDKIMKICEVLEVSPYELLTVTENSKYGQDDRIVVENGTDEYTVVKAMREMDISSRNRVLGYAEAMSQK